MTIRKIKWLASLTAAALLLGACGGDSGSDGDGDGGSGATAIAVGADEFAFSPDAWSVAADQDVSITIDNQGSVEHNWAILTRGTNISSEAEFSEDLVLFDFGSVDPGNMETKSFNVPASTYQVICTIQGHLDAGMEGSLFAG